MHVIATAGHVDHGKSMLVRALTGMEPDRWEAERRRGMTIDLGFAWTTLPSGEEIAFVDVPGHERFVSNMLAGAGPAPAVMFVVAADEGWMPQSADHLAAVDALGVRDGLLVVTRSDLADPAPALRQATLQIAATSLGRAVVPGGADGWSGSDQPAVGGGIEAVAVSALTGEGLPGLVAALGRLAARLPAPDPHAGVRLWLDRVFAMKGSGTVVTGTLQAGTVHVGDELVLTPSMRAIRVRGVQSLGAPATQVSGVARVALNLRGVGARDLSRGMALIAASDWTMTSLIDVRLTPRRAAARGESPGTIPRLPSRLTVHIGAARVLAQIRVLGDRVARLSLDRALPLRVGDRVLLRDPGAAADHAGTRPIFGAMVLDVLPPRLRGNGAAAAAHRELASWPEPPSTADLLRRHLLLRAATASAMGLRDLPPPVSGEWLADPAHWQGLRQRLVVAVNAHAARDPLAPGLPVEAARAELGLPDRGLVEALATWRGGGPAGEPIGMSGGYLRLADGQAGCEAGGERQEDGGRAVAGGKLSGGAGNSARLGHPALPAPVAEAVQAVLAGLADSPFSAPDAGRLRELGLDDRAAAAAERAGLLRRLPGNVVLAPDAPTQAARILAGLPQPFTAAEARQALRTSRRVVIPLLEWLDRERVTRRLPDDRRILRERPPEPIPNGEI